MKGWISWLLLGLLSVVFGIVVLGAPVIASISITLLAGVLLVVSGVLQVIGGFSAESFGSKLLAWIMGVLMVLLGWSFMANPLEGTLTIATVILILLAAGGIARILLALGMRGTQYFWPTLFSGVVSLGLAIFVWGMPGAPVKLLGILLGVEMLVNGFGLIFMAFFVKEAGTRA